MVKMVIFVILGIFGQDQGFSGLQVLALADLAGFGHFGQNEINGDGRGTHLCKPSLFTKGLT